MSSNKNINLLPEDLRIKEEKSKQPQSFHIDLVMPEAMEKPKSAGFFSLFRKKIKNIFSKKNRFEIPSVPKKSVEEKTAKNDFEAKQDREIPKKKREFSQEHIPKDPQAGGDRKVHYVKKAGFDFSLATAKGTPAVMPKKASFWSKLKNLFKRKPKEKKEEKKIEESYEVKSLKNGADSILLKGLNGADKKGADLTKAEATAVKSEEASKLHSSMPVPALIKPKVEKSDFLMPEVFVSQSEQKDSANGDLEKLQKFHQPRAKGSARFVDNSSGLDLIPKSFRMKNWRQIAILTSLALLGSFVIVASFYTYLYFQERNIQQQQERRSGQISELEEIILEYEILNKEISVLGEEIKTTHSLLNKHIYWTNFFTMLEKYTPVEVYYQGLSAGNKGALTLNAVGSDYNSPARFLKLLQEPEAQEFVSQVSISAVSLAENGVSFSVTLVLNENLFYYGYGPKEQSY